VQRLWEDNVELKNNLEDMEKKLLEGKMEIERTLDDYMKLKVHFTLILYFIHTVSYCSLLILVFFSFLDPHEKRGKKEIKLRSKQCKG